jgi:hypothetical protein
VARARGDWSALEGQVGLLAREDELAATDALPNEARTRLAGNDSGTMFPSRSRVTKTANSS